MPLVQLQGHSNKSPLTGERNLIEVPVDELVAILTETLGREVATNLAHALMKRLGIPEFTAENVRKAYCRLAAPRDYGDEPAHI